MRTTAQAVKDILDKTQLTDTDIETYIQTANLLIENIIQKPLTESLLTEIEKWLSAHLISITRERFTTEEKIGDASVKYAGKYLEGLHSTSYGQMVLILDTSNSFASQQKKEYRCVWK
ncbi:MAG: hypothetical protein B6I31_05515 [Desulfobacteraceae bacterium 4572_19]|nr:MAG: hypothetical protein B6I31_05515 [Desulfobacteraceae bacterium 4572_19]